MADQDQAPIFVGGPGQDSPDQPEAPETHVELVEVTLSGRTVKVTPDVAEAIQADSLKRTQDFGRQGDELRRLREKVETIESRQQIPPQPSTPQRDPDLDFWEKPSEQLDQRLQQFEQKLMQNISQAYWQQQELQAWWTHFYTENPGLRGKEQLVNAVLQQEYTHIKDLDGPSARKALASAVYGLTSIKAPDTGPQTILPNQPARTEGSTPNRQTRRTQPEPEPEQTSYSFMEFQKRRQREREQRKAKA